LRFCSRYEVLFVDPRLTESGLADLRRRNASSHSASLNTGRETVVWGGKMPSAGRTEQLRITAIWMNQAGRWQQVARHANVVPERSSP